MGYDALSNLIVVPDKTLAGANSNIVGANQGGEWDSKRQGKIRLHVFYSVWGGA